jgi:hypothetical protein
VQKERKKERKKIDGRVQEEEEKTRQERGGAILDAATISNPS